MLEIFLFFSYRNIRNVSYIYRNVIKNFCFLVIEIFIEMLEIFLFFSYRNIRNVSYIYRNVRNFRISFS